MEKEFQLLVHTIATNPSGWDIITILVSQLHKTVERRGDWPAGQSVEEYSRAGTTVEARVMQALANAACDHSEIPLHVLISNLIDHLLNQKGH